MAITDAGRNLLVQAAIGAGPTFFNNANSYIGVGDSTTAFASSQTDLQAATNKWKADFWCRDCFDCWCCSLAEETTLCDCS